MSTIFVERFGRTLGGYDLSQRLTPRPLGARTVKFPRAVGPAARGRSSLCGEALREYSVSAGGRAWLRVKARAQRPAADFASDRKNQKTSE